VQRRMVTHLVIGGKLLWHVHNLQILRRVVMQVHRPLAVVEQMAFQPEEVVWTSSSNQVDHLSSKLRCVGLGKLPLN